MMRSPQDSPGTDCSTNQSGAAEHRPVEILYLDEHVVVCNKPSGQFVHPTLEDYEEQQTLLDDLREQVAGPLHPAHRLDRGTSGAVIFARHPGAAARLNAAFRDSQIGKTYEAIVRGFPIRDFSVIRSLGPIRRKPSRRIRRMRRAAAEEVPAVRSAELPTDNDCSPERSPEESDRKPCATTLHRQSCYELALPCGRYPTTRLSHVHLVPHTGRRHQLRRHMNHASHPILGDTSYGDSRVNQAVGVWLGRRRLFLHARTLQFPHPERGDHIQVEAPYDSDFREALETLSACQIGTSG